MYSDSIILRLRPYLYIAPAMLILLTLTIFPLIYSLSKSFTDFNLFLGDGQGIGFRNFSNALSDAKIPKQLYFHFNLCDLLNHGAAYIGVYDGPLFARDGICPAFFDGATDVAHDGDAGGWLALSGY